MLLLLVLLALCSLLYYDMPVFVSYPDSAMGNDSLLNEWKQQLVFQQADSPHADLTPEQNRQTDLHPFTFDPNTIDEAGLYRMGLRPKLISTILHYREKGGHFSTAESMKKLYGLRTDEFESLLPFIQIASAIKKMAATDATPEHMGPRLEINQADSLALSTLPDCPPYLIHTILTYRRLLGGFVSLSQLKEISTLHEAAFQKLLPNIRLEQLPPRCINLNQAGYYELNAHPYLKGALTEAICAYRKTHHYHLDSIAQLREIPLINEEIFRKIAPYICTQ